MTHASAETRDPTQAQDGQPLLRMEGISKSFGAIRALKRVDFDLRAGEVATRQDVILAELDVEQEEKRLADAKRRVEDCRRELGQTDGGNVE